MPGDTKWVFSVWLPGLPRERVPVTPESPRCGARGWGRWQAGAHRVTYNRTGRAALPPQGPGHGGLVAKAWPGDTSRVAFTPPPTTPFCITFPHAPAASRFEGVLLLRYLSANHPFDGKRVTRAR